MRQFAAGFLAIFLVQSERIAGETHFLLWQAQTAVRGANHSVGWNSFSIDVWGFEMSGSHWRVVAVRRNGKEIVLDEYLALERAEAFQTSLLSINAFPEVRIEPDTDVSTAPAQGTGPCSSPLCERNVGS